MACQLFSCWRCVAGLLETPDEIAHHHGKQCIGIYWPTKSYVSSYFNLQERKILQGQIRFPRVLKCFYPGVELNNSVSGKFNPHFFLLRVSAPIPLIPYLCSPHKRAPLFLPELSCSLVFMFALPIPTFVLLLCTLMFSFCFCHMLGGGVGMHHLSKYLQ